MTAFSDFLAEKKITAEKLAETSHKLERRSADDFKLLIKRRDARAGGKKYADLSLEKPKLGRGVSLKQIANAAEGKPIVRLARQKIVRALKELVGGDVDSRALFAGLPTKRGKTIEKKKKK